MSNTTIRQDGWREFYITDFAEIHNNLRIPLSKMQRASRQGAYPYYGASGIVDYIDDYIFDGEYVLISEDGENLRSRQTPIAFKASGKFWVNNHAHILKGKKDYHNNLLIYYFAALNLNTFITGAVQPKLNKSSLLSIPIILPKNEQEQKAIVEVLSSLDEKINLLHCQNKTLENMAQVQFRKWFVEDADDGWEVGRLSEIAEHKKVNIKSEKHSSSEYHYYSIPAFDNGKTPILELGQEIKSNKYKVFGDSILISKLNPRFPRVWSIYGEAERNAICSTEFQVVHPKVKEYFSFIYCFLKSRQVIEELIGAAGGTSGSHQRVSPQDIFNLPYLNPPLQKVQEFSVITSDYWKKTLNNLRQIRILESLRNTLLPKLMSGTVRVKF